MIALVPSLVLWAAAICDPARTHMCAVPLSEGQVAPFAGQLLTPGLALELGQKAAEADAREAAAHAAEHADAAIEQVRIQGLRDADLKDFNATTALCQKDLDAARQALRSGRPWYTNAWLWTPLAFAGGALAVGFSLHLAGATR